MSNPWIRLYRDALHNPKIVTLSDRLYRVWNCCLLIADDTGSLPCLRDIACHLRMTIPEAEQVLFDLVECSLVDVENPGTSLRAFKMHDWNAHQYVTDKSTDRVRKFRSKNKSDTDETVMKRDETRFVTPPESETDTDTDTDYVSSTESMPREKVKQSFDLSFGRTKGKAKKGRGAEQLVERAAGFGVDAERLMSVLNSQPKVSNRAAYFTTLFANEIARKLPGINQELARDALWNKGGAAGTLYDLLMKAEAA